MIGLGATLDGHKHPALDEGPLGLGERACPRWKVRAPGFTEMIMRMELWRVGGSLIGWDRGCPSLNQTGLSEGLHGAV